MDILRTITERHPDDNFIIPMMEAVLEVIQTEKLFNENVGRIDLHLQERVSDWFRRWKPGDGTIGKFEVSWESRQELMYNFLSVLACLVFVIPNTCQLISTASFEIIAVNLLLFNTRKGSLMQ